MAGTKRVAIVGAALSDIGRVDTKTPFELHYQAATRAIADAGLTKDDIDGFGSSGMGMLAPIEIAEYLGLRPTWIDGTGVGGSHVGVHGRARDRRDPRRSRRGRRARRTGRRRAPISRRRRRTANLGFGGRGPIQFDVPFGHSLISKYAMATRRHMYRVRHDVEQLAEIAVSTRYNAGFNPEAFYRDPITIDEVNSSRMMADPLTKLHCCIRSDGGGAVVLTTEERARDLRQETGVGARHGRGVEPHDDERVGRLHRSPAVRERQARVRARRRDARRHRHLPDLRRVHAHGAASSLEALGFCKPGEGGPFVEDGKLRLGGALPTNTDGGGLSHCHPGMRGMFLLVEATRQLRGEAHGRQVENAQLACVNGTGGWFSSASTVILGA